MTDIKKIEDDCQHQVLEKLVETTEKLSAVTLENSDRIKVLERALIEMCELVKDLSPER